MRLIGCGRSIALCHGRSARGYLPAQLRAKRIPLVEYKAEAYDMFSQLMGSIKSEVLSNLFRSTTNLMAFEQFLATLPFGLNAPDQAPAGARPGPGPRLGEKIWG